MTNVDQALISGYDIKNDNIALLRSTTGESDAPLDPRLQDVFKHYIQVFSAPGYIRSGNISDMTLRHAAILWIFQEFYREYRTAIYVKKLDWGEQPNELFYDKYLYTMEPLIVAMSINSMAYLFFCTGEYALIKKILPRLEHISSVWRSMILDVPDAYQDGISIPTKSGRRTLRSYLRSCVPSDDYSGDKKKNKLSANNILPYFLRDAFNSIMTTHQMFKASDMYYLPDATNYTQYLKIQVACCKNIEDLVTVFKAMVATTFDPNVVFNDFRMKTTKAELLAALPHGSRPFNNPVVWFVLCYLYTRDKLTIDIHNTTTYDTNAFGPSMYDYIVNKQPTNILSYLNVIQYQKNRPKNDSNLRTLFKKFKDHQITVDPKRVHMKRGILVNLLSAGLGDIFCP